MSKKIETPSGLTLFYLGPDIAHGKLPALLYFSLSGEESLELEPFCHPPKKLEVEPIRTFSVTLPGHEEGLNKFHAMKFWADSIRDGKYLLEELITKLDESLNWLISEEIIDPRHVAVAGLSRGGLIAGLLAAKNNYIKTLVCFAPVVELSVLEDFSDFRDNKRLNDRASRLSLVGAVEKLTHLEHLRFYMATRDEKVNTDSCYHFIREMAEKVHEKRARHCHVELYLTTPIGQKGHGTAPHIFDEGTELIKRQLLR